MCFAASRTLSRTSWRRRRGCSCSVRRWRAGATAVSAVLVGPWLVRYTAIVGFAIVTAPVHGIFVSLGDIVVAAFTDFLQWPDVWETIKSAAKELINPWPSVQQEVQGIAETIEQAGGSVWELEFSQAWRLLNDVWGRMNSIFAVLSAWIGLVVAGASTIIGSVVPGAGTAAGFAFGMSVNGLLGIAVLGSVGLQLASRIVEAIVGLARENPEPEDAQDQYDTIAESAFTVGAILGMSAIGAAAAKIAQKLVGAINRFVPAARRRRRRKEKSRRRRDCPTKFRKCFLAGTLVKTRKGLIPIEQIEADTDVLSRDIQSGRWIYAPVVEAFRNDYDRDVITLELSGQDGSLMDRIECTGNHPFWVAAGAGLYDRPLTIGLEPLVPGGAVSGRWVQARDLKEGDTLTSEERGPIAVDSVTVRIDQVPIFNLHIASVHTYTVGTLCVLVHNMSEPDPCAPGRIPFGSQRGASGLRSRADDLSNVARRAEQDTVAVIRGRNRVTGEERVFIAKQGNQQAMPRRWQGKLQAGEEWVPGVDRNFHAEENILRNPNLKDWDFIEGGTSRNVCSPNDRCGRAIQDAGMQLGGPEFGGRQGTTSRVFWRQEGS